MTSKENSQLSEAGESQWHTHGWRGKAYLMTHGFMSQPGALVTAVAGNTSEKNMRRVITHTFFFFFTCTCNYPDTFTFPLGTNQYSCSIILSLLTILSTTLLPPSSAFLLPSEGPPRDVIYYAVFCRGAKNDISPRLDGPHFHSLLWPLRTLEES